MLGVFGRDFVPLAVVLGIEIGLGIDPTVRLGDGSPFLIDIERRDLSLGSQSAGCSTLEIRR